MGYKVKINYEKLENVRDRFKNDYQNQLDELLELSRACQEEIEELEGKTYKKMENEFEEIDTSLRGITNSVEDYESDLSAYISRMKDAQHAKNNSQDIRVDDGLDDVLRKIKETNIYTYASSVVTSLDDIQADKTIHKHGHGSKEAKARQHNQKITEQVNHHFACGNGSREIVKNLLYKASDAKDSSVKYIDYMENFQDRDDVVDYKNVAKQTIKISAEVGAAVAAGAAIATTGGAAAVALGAGAAWGATNGVLGARHAYNYGDNLKEVGEGVVIDTGKGAVSALVGEGIGVLSGQAAAKFMPMITETQAFQTVTSVVPKQFEDVIIKKTEKIEKMKLDKKDKSAKILLQEKFEEDYGDGNFAKTLVKKGAYKEAKTLGEDVVFNTEAAVEIEKELKEIGMTMEDILPIIE